MQQAEAAAGASLQNSNAPKSADHRSGRLPNGCDCKEGRCTQHQLLSDHLLALLHLQGMQSAPKMQCPAAEGACWGPTAYTASSAWQVWLCMCLKAMSVRSALRCSTAQKELQRGWMHVILYAI